MNKCSLEFSTTLRKMIRLNGKRLFISYWFYHICIIVLWCQLSCINSLIVKKSNMISNHETSSKQSDNYKMENNLGSITDYNPSTNSKKRNKRGAPFLLGLWGFCLNYPLCCDDEGEDTCPFFCPVCPIKRDICKSSCEIYYQFGITNGMVFFVNMNLTQ